MEQLELELADQTRALSRLDWAYQFSSKSLVERVDGQRLIYGHWDHLFGGWRAGQKLKTAEIIPNWPMFTASGTWADPRDHLQARFKYRGFAYTSKWARQANAAFAAYFSSIPRPYRSIVGPLGGFQWLALDLIWQNKNFARFLEKEIHQNGGHFVCAALVYANAFKAHRAARAQLSVDLQTRNRAQLIKSLTGHDQARSLVKIFSKLGKPIQNAKFYATLAEVMKCPIKAKLAAHSQNITWPKLSLLRDLPTSLLSPSLLNLLVADLNSANQARRISSYLKELPSQVEQAVSQSLKAGGRPDKLKGRIAKWEIKLAQSLGFPEPPLPAHKLLVPLSNPDQMYREGQTMGNCLFDLVEDALEGEAYFYHWAGSEPATVMVCPNSDGTWQLVEAFGFKNQSLTQKTFRYLENFIEHLTGQARDGPIGRPPGLFELEAAQIS